MVSLFSQGRYVTRPMRSSMQTASLQSCARRLRTRISPGRRKSRSSSTAAARCTSTRYPPISGCVPSDRPLFSLSRLRGRVGEGALATCAALVERRWSPPPPPPPWRGGGGAGPPGGKAGGVLSPPPVGGGGGGGGALAACVVL